MSPKKLYPLAFMAALFVIIYLVSQSVPEETIRTIITQAGPFGPIILILGILLTHVIAPLGSAPFIFVGYYAYGQTTIVYMFVAAVISSAVNFLLAQKFGRSLVEKFAGREPLARIDSFSNKYGLRSLFLLRLTQAEFHDVISYAAGLTNLKFWPYFLVSTIGFLPWNILKYFLSAQTTTPATFTALHVVLGWLLLGLLFLWLGLKKLSHKHPL